MLKNEKAVKLNFDLKTEDEKSVTSVLWTFAVPEVTKYLLSANGLIIPNFRK